MNYEFEYFSATSSLKKQASVSQHSSISQADDISSPYARVRSPPHAYDKLRRTEHPYAQVVQPGTSGSTAQVAVTVDDELLSPISRRGLSSTVAGGAGGESNQSLLDEREASTVVSDEGEGVSTLARSNSVYIIGYSCGIGYRRTGLRKSRSSIHDSSHCATTAAALQR